MKPEYKAPSWLDIFRYLYKNKYIILSIPFSTAVVVAIVTLFIPNKYTSTANLLPSQRPSVGFSLFTEGGSLSNIASSVLGTGESEEANRYLVLLNSITTKKRIIQEFDLINIYELSDSEYPMIFAMDILDEHTTFESKEEGNFIISVENENPILAKEMASFYVELLNQFNTGIVTKDARLYREFIENRYKKALSDADSLKSEVINFQTKYGVIELPEQVQAYFSLISALTAKQIESEFKVRLLSESVNEQSDSYKNAILELESITYSLNEVYSDTNSQNLLLNFKELPVLAAEYFELNLEAEIQAEIQKFLIPLYEQAKMEEAKSLPIVSIVDEPQVALKKSSPRRSFIVISTAGSTFLLTLLFFILKFSFLSNKEYFSYLRN